MISTWANPTEWDKVDVDTRIEFIKTGHIRYVPCQTDKPKSSYGGDAEILS